MEIIDTTVKSLKCIELLKTVLSGQKCTNLTSLLPTLDPQHLSFGTTATPSYVVIYHAPAFCSVFHTATRIIFLNTKSPHSLLLEAPRGDPIQHLQKYLNPLDRLYEAHPDLVPALPSSASFLDTPHLPRAFNSSLTKVLQHSARHYSFTTHVSTIELSKPCFSNTISHVCVVAICSQM